MNIKAIKVIGVVASVVGAAASVIGNLATEKLTDAKLAEKVAEALKKES